MSHLIFDSETLLGTYLWGHFVKEKNLQLVMCDVEDGDKVDTAFVTLIDIIMSSILPSALGG